MGVLLTMKQEIYNKIKKTKKETRDFFELMENHQMDDLNLIDKVMRFLGAIALISIIVSMVCYVNDSIKMQDKEILIPVTGISIMVFVVTVVGSFIMQFFKNSILFRQGIIRKGIINFVGFAIIVYAVLFLGYFYSANELKDFFKSLFVPATTLCAAILAIIGVHYNLSRQRQENECKNNLVFSLEPETVIAKIIKLQSYRENLTVRIYLKNISDNRGFLIGMYRLNSGEVYEIASVPYCPILPQTVYAIDSIQFNESDDQLVLIYTDINKIFYYLTFDIKDRHTVALSDNGKCDWSFFQRAVNLSKYNLEKMKNGTRDRKYATDNEESNIIQRKVETKPAKTLRKGDFDFILNDAGEIMTDSKLLDDLRKERLKLSRELKKPAYTVFNNQQLVALATYKPTSREDFISIYSLGEGKFNLYGDRFINIILKFEDGNSTAA